MRLIEYGHQQQTDTPSKWYPSEVSQTDIGSLPYAPSTHEGQQYWRPQQAVSLGNYSRFITPEHAPQPHSFQQSAISYETPGHSGQQAQRPIRSMSYGEVEGFGCDYPLELSDSSPSLRHKAPTFCPEEGAKVADEDAPSRKRQRSP